MTAVLHREWDREPGSARVPAGLPDGPPGQPACPATPARRSTRPIPASSCLRPSTATSFRARGSRSTASLTGGIAGRKPGTEFTFPYFIYAARAGFAWNVFGDGKTALRGSWGIFYNFPRIHGRTRRVSVLRWLPDLVPTSDPLGHVQRHHDRHPWQPAREPGERDRRRLRQPLSNSHTRTSRSSATSASTPWPKSPTSATSRGTTAGSSTATGYRSTCMAIRLEPGVQRAVSMPTRCATRWRVPRHGLGQCVRARSLCQKRWRTTRSRCRCSAA